MNMMLKFAKHPRLPHIPHALHHPHKDIDQKACVGGMILILPHGQFPLGHLGETGVIARQAMEEEGGHVSQIGRHLDCVIVMVEGRGSGGVGALDHAFFPFFLF